MATLESRLLEGRAIPNAWWTTPDLLGALRRRDVGHLFRMIQKMTGASQTRIGVATGLSQAQVSEIMSGKRQVTSLDVAVRIVQGLQIPEPARTALLLGDLDGVSSAGIDSPRAGLMAESLGSAARTSPPPDPDGSHVDVEAVYATRSEFVASMALHKLFDQATNLRIVGLSLNLLCQHYGDNQLLRLLQNGAHLRCLFLDPAGESIRVREQEEGYASGFLSALTQLNIENLIRRVRDRLPEDCPGVVEVGVYNEPVRFNIILIDDELCIAQPYLPEARGVDAPTMVIRKRPSSPTPGLYETFEQVFTAIWERRRPL